MKASQVIGGAVLVGNAYALNSSCSATAIQASLPAGAKVNFAYPIEANGTFEVPKSETGYPDSPVKLPSLCAVSVQARSIGNTTYGFGLFLPQEWNGRYLAVGNGGFAGGVDWVAMGAGTRYGFASMSTDTGHNSSSPDGTWAYNQPDKVENWGHLAMHGSVELSKTIISSFYKQNISYSYYSGCSTGGRQGLKEAEFYPEDFDGIVAGAPAWWTAHMQPWTARISLFNLPKTADYHIPGNLFPVVNAEIIKQCDPQDGVVDNIISDPQGCNFRPEKLLCGASNATATNGTGSNCLTGPQIDTLYNIYSDYVGENNKFIFPGLWLGSEGQPAFFVGNEPNPLGTHYVQYFLGKGPEWSFNDYTDDIIALSDEINPGNATVGFDLSRFHAKGGKILSYHGMVDPLIPTGSTQYFYNHVLRTLQPRGVDVDSFFRYFLVPGMSHCSGTQESMNAPWYFAAANQQAELGDAVFSTPGFEDKEHDVLMAMMAWVEKGEAPDYVIGTKFVNDSTHDEVMKQRPLCMYPNMARYKEEGDINDPASWECKEMP